MKLNDQMLKQLQAYAQLDFSELGECCMSLLRLWDCRSYFINKGFKDALESELIGQLENFINFSEIVTEKRMKDVYIKHLQWKDQ